MCAEFAGVDQRHSSTLTGMEAKQAIKAVCAPTFFFFFITLKPRVESYTVYEPYIRAPTAVQQIWHIQDSQGQNRGTCKTVKDSQGQNRGTCKTVKARFWPWLSGQKSLKSFEVCPLRSEADSGAFLNPDGHGGQAGSESGLSPVLLFLLYLYPFRLRVFASQD